MSDLFSEEEMLNEAGPDDETAEPALEQWLLEDYGTMTVEERITMAKSLDRYDIAEKIRSQG